LSDATPQVTPHVTPQVEQLLNVLKSDMTRETKLPHNPAGFGVVKTKKINCYRIIHCHSETQTDHTKFSSSLTKSLTAKLDIHTVL
jgi:hypothetical protein